ncbi:glutathionyl-hydroquinone reductase [Paraburkholderia sp. MM5477-R1]
MVAGVLTGANVLWKLPYVSLACPWAHRALIVRALEGLNEMVSMSVIHWLMLEHGWTFAEGPGTVPEARTRKQSSRYSRRWRGSRSRRTRTEVPGWSWARSG